MPASPISAIRVGKYQSDRMAEAMDQVVLATSEPARQTNKLVLKIAYSAPAGWDLGVETGVGATLTQSSFFADLRAFLDGAVPVYLSCEDGEGNVKARLLVLRDYAGSRTKGDGFVQCAYYWLGRGLGGHLSWHGGPVFVDLEDWFSSFRTLLEGVKSLAGQWGVGCLGPGYLSPAIPMGGGTQIRDWLLANGFAVRPWATLLVDLRGGEAAVWEQLDRSAKKAIRKAERSGIEVRRAQTLEELETCFYQPYLSAERAWGRAAQPWRMFEALFKKDVQQRYGFFWAEQMGQVVGTLGGYSFGGMVTEIGSAMTAKAYARKLPAQDLLHWEILRWAVGQGCHTFNLAGINPAPTNPKEAGIRQFKEKWGGRYTDYDMVSADLGWRGKAQGGLRALARYGFRAIVSKNRNDP